MGGSFILGNLSGTMPGNKCRVPNCPVRSDRSRCVPMHYFENVHNNWHKQVQDVIAHHRGPLPKKMAVCSRHFTDECYTIEGQYCINSLAPGHTSFHLQTLANIGSSHVWESSNDFIYHFYLWRLLQKFSVLGKLVNSFAEH